MDNCDKPRQHPARFCRSVLFVCHKENRLNENGSYFSLHDVSGELRNSDIYGHCIEGAELGLLLVIESVADSLISDCGLLFADLFNYEIRNHNEGGLCIANFIYRYY